MPRVYAALSQIHADPKRRRLVWFSLSKLMGGAHARWNADVEHERKGVMDGFHGMNTIGSSLDDYDTFDQHHFDLNEKNSVRSCSLSKLRDALNKAKQRAEKIGAHEKRNRRARGAASERVYRSDHPAVLKRCWSEAEP